MKKAVLHLAILPSGLKRDLLVMPQNFMSDTDKDSTAVNININKRPFGYTIIYEDKVLTSLRIDVLIKNIQMLMKESLPDYLIEFTVDYFYEMNDGSTLINSMILEALLHIDQSASNSESYLSPLVYRRSASIKKVINMIYGRMVSEEQGQQQSQESNSGMVIDQAGYMHDMNQETPEDINEFIRDLYGIDLDDDDDKKKKKKKRAQQFASSRVIRAASNPRKIYNRHGVIVCKNKKAIKKDAQTIKDFLEDFIPGNAKWKKDLRKELRKRWMRTFVITKGQLKQLEKDYQKKKKKSSNSERNTKIVDLTNKMLNVPIDRWSDPSL